MSDIARLGEFWAAVELGDLDRLARFVEDGRSLSGLSEWEREILAKLIRGEALRCRGQKPRNLDREKRDQAILANVALNVGRGLPAYFNGNDVDADEACGLVADVFEVSRSTVIRLWRNRKPSATLKLMEQLGREIESTK